MKEKMKICIIGCGRFARNFVPLFKAHPVVEKVYVCDIRPERAEDYKARFDVDIIDSFEKAISREDINAVAIFTPRETHGKLVIQALKAGKHVYSAVPCSIDIEDICEIKELVEKTHLTYSMGETGYYRAATCFCREKFAQGQFGAFVYGEAQYNHDIRNMEMSFQSSGGDRWREYAGIPPFFYPTHSTSMILGSMPGVYVKSTSAMGFAKSPRTDIFAPEKNLYNNPFSNSTALFELSNGGVARISENRCVGWKSPETYISQFYGTDGCYEFSVARHSFAHWKEDDDKNVDMIDVTELLQPKSIYELIEKDYRKAISDISRSAGFFDTCPIQPTYRLPKEFEGLKNGHNGTHHFLIDDFCRAYETGLLSPTNIWQVARFNIPGLVAHKSALEGGRLMDVPDLGNPPEDWKILSL